MLRLLQSFQSLGPLLAPHLDHAEIGVRSSGVGIGLKYLGEVALRIFHAALGERILPALKRFAGSADLVSSGAGAACCLGVAIAVPASRSKTKNCQVIRALDTGMTLCCSVRQCTLSIQAAARTLSANTNFVVVAAA
jgi:hypothetical protein